VSLRRGQFDVLLTFTLDLEQHRSDGVLRYPAVVERLLEDLGDLDVRGTFFVVGDVVAAQPDLVRRVAAAGHELASHDFRHVAWRERSPVEVLADLRRAREDLEQLIGRTVRGVRAPFFSLTRKTPWGPSVVAEAGFDYSSSVLPAANPMSGLPGAPRRPFYWSEGPLELPVPLLGRGKFALPVLGGLYLRLLPMASARTLKAGPGPQAMWTYAHPYDLDPEENLARVHGSGALLTALLAMRRRRMWPRLRELLRNAAAPPLAERVDAGEFAGAPVWSLR
jgi:polysaccharide deacetylase family protein (PEP-CTERM system associated)